MILKAFSVYDGKAKAFHPPIFRTTLGVALRDFEGWTNDADGLISKYPQDFTFYEIGEYNDQNAELTPHEVIKLVGTALEYKKDHVTSLQKIISPLETNSSEGKKELVS